MLALPSLCVCCGRFASFAVSRKVHLPLFYLEFGVHVSCRRVVLWYIHPLYSPMCNAKVKQENWCQELVTISSGKKKNIILINLSTGRVSQITELLTDYHKCFQSNSKSISIKNLVCYLIYVNFFFFFVFV